MPRHKSGSSGCELTAIFVSVALNRDHIAIRQLYRHLQDMAVELPNGDVIAVEGHSDKYRGQFAAGASAFVAWQAGRSTVIKQ